MKRLALCTLGIAVVTAWSSAQAGGNGRDGKVIAMNAHGAELERLLQKQFGVSKGKPRN
jgi:hypothetical protein